MNEQPSNQGVTTIDGQNHGHNVVYHAVDASQANVATTINTTASDTNMHANMDIAVNHAVNSPQGDNTSTHATTNIIAVQSVDRNVPGTCPGMRKQRAQTVHFDSNVVIIPARRVNRAHTISFDSSFGLKWILTPSGAARRSQRIQAPVKLYNLGFMACAHCKKIFRQLKFSSMQTCSIKCNRLLP